MGNAYIVNSLKREASSPLGRLPDFSKYVTAGDPQLLDGYFFRILTAQGNAAKGGRHNYVAEETMLSAPNGGP